MWTRTISFLQQIVQNTSVPGKEKVQIKNSFLTQKNIENKTTQSILILSNIRVLIFTELEKIKYAIEEENFEKF